MGKKKRLCALLAALLMLVGTLLSPLPAAAVSETVSAGDKVTVTGAEGHQYYYYTADGTSGYCWASFMCVAVSERNGVDVDYINGDWKPYYAWCASWGESVPADNQEYILSDGMHDENGYYYIDENLHKGGVQGYRINFDRALSCIKAAERIALKNGHNSFPIVYRYAIEIAVRCGSDEVNVDKLNITGGYSSQRGMEILDEAELTVAAFYALVKEICTEADTYPYVYTPPKTEITATRKKQNVYQGDYLILGEYTLEDVGVTAEVTTGSSAGVEAVVNGTTLTVRIPKKDIPLEKIKWKVKLSYVNGETYKMLFGQPIDKNGNVLDTPQNIILYDTEPDIAYGEVSGEYDSKEEKATVTVSKTDEDGSKLPDVEFTLYKAEGNKLTYIEAFPADENGIAEWINLDLGYYLLTETPQDGWEAHAPEAWEITGATSASYTTVDGVTGWLLYLAPGDTAATVNAVNRKTVGDLLIVKTEVGGNAVGGISFDVYPVAADGTLSEALTGTTDTAGLLLFAKLPIGNYFITEEAQNGWQAHKPEEWTITGGVSLYTELDGIEGWLIQLNRNGTIIRAVNERITGSLMLSAYGGTPIICVDNDEAGEKFRARHKEAAVLLPTLKDWNDDLQKTKGVKTQ